MTTRELAEHFEVSKRTILRDLEAFGMAGIPICSVRGRGGGISVPDNFILNKTAVSQEEQNQILFALQRMAAAQNPDTGSVLSRLTSLFEKTDTNRIEVDFSRWGKSKPDKEKFELLKQAILGKAALVFSYAGSCGDRTTRTVYPLKLVFKSKSWYLQAYCLTRQDYRLFKVNRMQDLEVLADSFAGQDLTVPHWNRVPHPLLYT